METNDISELVKLMRHPETGVPLRAVKSFLSRIPDVFTGEDLVGWLRKTYDIDTADEAIHLGLYHIFWLSVIKSNYYFHKKSPRYVYSINSIDYTCQIHCKYLSYKITNVHKKYL